MTTQTHPRAGDRCTITHPAFGTRQGIVIAAYDKIDLVKLDGETSYLHFARKCVSKEA